MHDIMSCSLNKILLENFYNRMESFYNAFYKLKDLIILTSFLTLAWLAAYALHTRFFESNHHLISIFFIPSSLRVFAVLVFREKAIPGLFVGAYLTNIIWNSGLSFGQNVLISFSSSITAYVACIILERLNNKQYLSSKMSFTNIVHISLFFWCH